jgi:plasmid maintenance system antidote protein VapI
VRSGVPTVREEIEEAKEEASLAFNPDWVSAPGDTIADMLEERGITPKELAKRADLSLEYVNRLLKGEAEITLATAIGLEVALGPTEEFWLAREANYRKALRARSEWRRGEVKRERVEEAADWRTSDSGTWPMGHLWFGPAPDVVFSQNVPVWRDWRTTDDASLWPTRMSVDDITVLRKRLGPTPWHQMYQGAFPERDQQEDAVIGFKAKMDEWPKGLRQLTWEAAQAEAKTYKPGAEGYQRVYVEVAPCQAVEANTEPVVVGHAIGVDFAHGPGKAVTTVWRVQDGKFDVVETVEDPLAKAVELLDAIRGQVGEGDDAESFKMRLAQRVAQELVDLLRWRADRVDQRTENGRRARLHNNAMVSMLAFNDDFTAWREDVMVASGKRRDPDAGKKRSE